LAARFAARHSRLLRRLVLWATPGLRPGTRLPAGLLAAAIRLDLRPSERNLLRFAGWPFHLTADRYADIEVHDWAFGGRSS
jgi:hypothetical protein